MARPGKTRLAAASATVLALGAGALTTFGGQSATQPAMLPLEPLPISNVAALDDGHNHYLVRIAEQPDARTSAESASAPRDETSEAIDSNTVVLAEGDGDDLPPVLSLADLAGLGDRLDYLDGDGDMLVAVLTDGTRLAVTTDDAPTTAPSAAAVPSLADHPDVIDIADVGDGWFAVTSDLDADAFDALARSAGATEVGEDVIIETASDDEYSHVLWGLENDGTGTFHGVDALEDADVDGTEARAAVRGAGVVVAVIDSGAVTNHPDLPSFWHNTDEICGNLLDDDLNGYVDDCNGWDFYNNDNTPFDAGVDNDHGTHVTGTIAAVPDNGIGTAGLAPGVTIMNLKALQNGATRMSTAAEAVRYAVDNGAQVINASWGSTGATRANVIGLEAAIEYANARGVIVVAAAGNDGVNLDANPSFPASFPQQNVISVGALQADGAPAGFSNRSASQVDLHAPGHYIVAPVGGSKYSAMQGTSMAAPHVAAGFAMLLAQDPTLTIADARATMLDNVDHYPTLAGTSVTGGSMNIARALGIDTDDSASGLQVVVDGLHDLAAGESETISIRTTLLDSSIAHDRDVNIRATLLTAVGGVQFGVVDHAVAVNGRGTATDDYAQVILGDSVASTGSAIKSGISATVTTELPEGLYALVVEVVDAEDPDAAYGPPAVVYALVGPARDIIDPVLDGPVLDDPTGTVPGVTVPVTLPDGTTDIPDAPAVDTPVDEILPGNPDATSPGEATPDNPSNDDTPPATRSPRPTTTTTTAPPAQADEPASTGGGGGRAPQTTTTTTTRPPTSDAGSGGGGGRAPADDGTTDEETGPVADHGWTVTKVSPVWGTPDGGRTMVIHGDNLPQQPIVKMGDAFARVSRANYSSIIVKTPPGRPGVVDVSVTDDNGRTLVFPDAYTYAEKKPEPNADRQGPYESDPGTATEGDDTDDTSPDTSGDATTPTTTPGIAPGTGNTGTTLPPVDLDDVIEPIVEDPQGSVPTIPDVDPGDVLDPIDQVDPVDIAEPYVPLGRRRHTLAATATADLVPGVNLHLVEVGIELPFSTGDWAQNVCVRTSCAAIYGADEV